jgi:glycoprotein-N-acetylgalactosamine 3-beta-galactosyltransferase
MTDKFTDQQRVFSVSFVQRHNVEIADRLRRDVRILCLVLTQLHFHESQTEAVKNTWGRRCTNLIFVTNAEAATLVTLKLRAKSGDDWEKFKELFQEINDHHIDQYHWFYVANDRT